MGVLVMVVLRFHAKSFNRKPNHRNDRRYPSSEQVLWRLAGVYSNACPDAYGKALDHDHYGTSNIQLGCYCKYH